MVQYDIIENLHVYQWNVLSPRLQEIFRQIFTKPLAQKTIIHIYEPLADIYGSVASSFHFGNDARNIFILFSAEGHGEQEYDRLLPRLLPGGDLKNVSQNDIILYTAAFCLSSDTYRHVQNWSGILNNTLDLSGRKQRMTPATKCCTFLNREHRWQRQALFEELHRRNMLDCMNVSYIKRPPTTEFKSLYPCILDKEKVSFTDGYNLAVGADATFNIVSESSYENLGSLESIEVPGVSEKTYKTILTCQIPIFLSTAYTVYHFRMLGFYVFDDIVDHSYDLIEDPVQRIQSVADEVERRCEQWSLGADSEIRNRLKNRFANNLRLMEHYSHPRMELMPWYRHFCDMGLLKRQP